MLLVKLIDKVRTQLKSVRAGGVSVFVKKILAVPTLVLAVLVVLLIRAVRPLVWVRFGSLVCDRIGHFALNNALYICEREAGLHPGRALDCFFYLTPVCNGQLKTMWDRTLRTVPRSKLATMLYRVNLWLPGSPKHVISTSDHDWRSLVPQSRQHLVFTRDEERKGQEELRRIGVPEGAPFVCVHIRDAAYLRSIHPDLDLSYHDYRDASLNSVIPAIKHLAERGYYVLRMGALVEEELNLGHDRVIDYARNGRTEFLDIYLCARCALFLGSPPAGINALARVFQRPMAFVNVIPPVSDVLGEVSEKYRPTTVFIPKKLRLRAEGRLLKFRETVEMGLTAIFRGDLYDERGVDVINNTQEEIAEVAREICDHVGGTWHATEEDEDLQRRYFSAFGIDDRHKTPIARVGKEFLRQNRRLLE